MTQVLIVDDVPGIQTLLRGGLQDEGYVVTAVPDAVAALGVLQTSFGAMVVMFGITSGPTLLQRAIADLQIGRHAFVLLTAYPEGLTDEWRELLARLQVPVVAKPFEWASLYEAVACAAARLV